MSAHKPVSRLLVKRILLVLVVRKLQNVQLLFLRNALNSLGLDSNLTSKGGIYKVGSHCTSWFCDVVHSIIPWDNGENTITLWEAMMWYVCSMRDFILSHTALKNTTYLHSTLALLNYFLPSEESISSNFLIASFFLFLTRLWESKLWSTLRMVKIRVVWFSVHPKKCLHFKGPQR